jgi:hypothetical protein
VQLYLHPRINFRDFGAIFSSRLHIRCYFRQMILTVRVTPLHNFFSLQGAVMKSWQFDLMFSSQTDRERKSLPENRAVVRVASRAIATQLISPWEARTSDRVWRTRSCCRETPFCAFPVLHHGRAGLEFDRPAGSCRVRALRQIAKDVSGDCGNGTRR